LASGREGVLFTRGEKGGMRQGSVDFEKEKDALGELLRGERGEERKAAVRGCH